MYDKLVGKTVKIVIEDDNNTKVFRGPILEHDSFLNKFLMFNIPKQHEVLINISNIVTLEVQDE